MAEQEEIVHSKSSNTKSTNLMYRPSFLLHEDVDKSIEMTNKKDENLVDDTDLERITTAWIHRLQHFVATVESRVDKKRQYRFQPKFTEK